MKLTNFGKMMIYRIYSLLAYIFPMLLVYFVFFFTGTPKTQVGFWGYIIIFMCLIFFKKVVMKAMTKQPMLTISIILFIFGLVLSDMGESMAIIGLASLIGALCSTIFLKVEKVYEANAYIAVNGNVNVMQRNPAKAIPDKEAWKIAYGVINE